MTSPVLTCSPDDSLEHAARLLWEHDCGVLPVVAEDGVVRAALTDRDICMAAYTTGRRLAELRVGDCMSSDVVTCGENDPIETAAHLMQRHTVRRLPVVGPDGKPCGLLSMNDLALAAEDEAAIGRELLRILAAVCRHTGPAQERGGPGDRADATSNSPPAGRAMRS